MEKSIKRSRNLGIELLRIAAMLFIVASHYSIHGATTVRTMPITVNKFLLQCVCVGDLGVDIFMFISGYCGVKGSFKFKKLLLLVTQVLFYSITFSFIFLDKGEITYKTFFPTVFGEYWFFTAYIIVYLFSPYINKLMNSLNGREASKFIATAMIAWSFVKTFTFGSKLFVSQLSDILFLYVIGAYFALFVKKEAKSLKNGIILTAVCGIASAGFIAVTDILSQKIEFKHYLGRMMQERWSPLTIGISIGLFLIFSNLNIKPNKFNTAVIGNVAGCTFGVYLIHDHPLVRKWLWKTVFVNAPYINAKRLIVHLALSVLIVFAGCTIVEFIRKNTIERLFSCIYDFIDRRIKKPVDLEAKEKITK